jgi:hypothetical protein
MCRALTRRDRLVRGGERGRSYCDYLENLCHRLSDRLAYRKAAREVDHARKVEMVDQGSTLSLGDAYDCSNPLISPPDVATRMTGDRRRVWLGWLGSNAPILTQRMGTDRDCRGRGEGNEDKRSLGALQLSAHRRSGWKWPECAMS